MSTTASGIRLSVAGLMLALAPPALSQGAADFYAGKTITLIVGSGPGGGYDIAGRLLAQHLGRHLPGSPAVVVRNMPGASSIVAAQHMFNAAPRDGTVLGMLQPTFVIESILDRSLRFAPEQFTWIGRLDASALVGIVWHTSPVQSIADARQREASMSAIGASGTAATVPWALNNLIGTRFKVVLGYQSSPETGLAMERGEVHGTGSTSWEYLETKRDWLEQGRVRVLYTIALDRLRQQPDVPTILELVDNDADRKALSLIAAGSTIGRALVSTPTVPVERTTALRVAFEAAVKDPALLADAVRRNLGVDAMTGAALQRLVGELASTPADIVAKVQAVTRRPR